MVYAKRDIYAEVGGVRRIVAFAGQPVPNEYEAFVDRTDVSAEQLQSAEAAAAAVEPRATPDPDKNDLPDLDSLKRDELDALAAQMNVEDPQDLPNIAAVKEAIRAAHLVGR